MTTYDSAADTKAHIKRVQELLAVVVEALQRRAHYHDASKLGAIEKPIFDEFTSKLKGITYGSEEYKAMLAQMKPALENHYAMNSHHPEHFARVECVACHHPLPSDGVPSCPRCGGGRFENVPKVDGMSLLDLIEMLCDWKAAGERHANGSMEASLKHNRKRFEISAQLQAVLENTARELNMLAVKVVEP